MLMPKRAATSVTVAPPSITAWNASNWSAGCIGARTAFSARLISPASSASLATEHCQHPAYKEALRAVSRIEETYELSRSETFLLREALSVDAMEGLSRPDLPLSAPEQWADRKGIRENPVSFIKRVYAEWLGKGLKRSHLLALDKPLYTALGVWLHRHPESGFPELEP